MSGFIWDEEKELANIAKHGVSFVDACLAFEDDHRIIVEDLKHSQIEGRWVCLGRVRNDIMTVCFTYRSETIRIISAGYWRKGRKMYEKKWQN